MEATPATSPAKAYIPVVRRLLSRRSAGSCIMLVFLHYFVVEKKMSAEREMGRSAAWAYLSVELLDRGYPSWVE